VISSDDQRYRRTTNDSELRHEASGSGSIPFIDIVIPIFHVSHPHPRGITCVLPVARFI